MLYDVALFHVPEMNCTVMYESALSLTMGKGRADEESNSDNPKACVRTEDFTSPSICTLWGHLLNRSGVRIEPKLGELQSLAIPLPEEVHEAVCKQRNRFKVAIPVNVGNQ